MKTIYKLSISVLVGVLLLITLLIAINRTVADTPRPSPLTINSNVVKLNEIKELEAILQSGDLKPEDRSSIEAKLALAKKEATLQAGFTDSGKIWSEKQTAIVQLTQSPLKPNNTVNLPTGIISNPSSTGVSSEDNFSTVWVEKENDSYIQIFTGFERNDMKQGVLVIKSENPYRITRVLTPRKTGALVILNADGDFLLIKAENGNLLKFNKKTYQLFDAETGELLIDVLVTHTPGSVYPPP